MFPNTNNNVKDIRLRLVIDEIKIFDNLNSKHNLQYYNYSLL